MLISHDHSYIVLVPYFRPDQPSSTYFQFFDKIFLCPLCILLPPWMTTVNSWIRIQIIRLKNILLSSASCYYSLQSYSLPQICVNTGGVFEGIFDSRVVIDMCNDLYRKWSIFISNIYIYIFKYVSIYFTAYSLMLSSWDKTSYWKNVRVIKTRCVSNIALVSHKYSSLWGDLILSFKLYYVQPVTVE